MSYLPLIDEADGTALLQQYHEHVRPILAARYKFMIHPYQVPFGYIDPSNVRCISWPEYWKVDHDNLTIKLCCDSNTFPDRCLRMKQTLEWEREKGTFGALTYWSGDMCNVYGPNREVVVSMDRIAAPLFGIITYSVQLCVMSKTPQGPRYWTAQRNRYSPQNPGKLEHFVTGPLHSLEIERPIDGIVRLAKQNTFVPEDFIRANAIPRGKLTFYELVDSPFGNGWCPHIQPQVQYVYEIVTDQCINPIARGLQISRLYVLNAQELLQGLQNRLFTGSAVMAWIDAFVRNGNVDAENEKDFAAICMRLHRKFGLLGE